MKGWEEEWERELGFECKMKSKNKNEQKKTTKQMLPGLDFFNAFKLRTIHWGDMDNKFFLSFIFLTCETYFYVVYTS